MKPETDKNSLAYRFGQIFASTLAICGLIIVLGVTAKILTLLF